MPGPKQIAQASIVGQQGINLIEEVLLAMGFTWHPTNQGLECGLDGFLEIRDCATGQALNSVIFVQSRATEGTFTGETSSSLEYTCDERDLEYWLKGNAPIILVRSRPKTREAYWVSIKEYFKDLPTRAKRKIVFDKVANAFDGSAKTHLLRLAVPPESGIYCGPKPRPERVYSNLIPVQTTPPKIWIGDTDFRWDSQIKQHFRDKGLRMGGEWFLKDKKVYSFYDLGQEAWLDICDQGTVESFDSEEWAYSAEELRRKDFVRLLNLSLSRKLYHLDIRFDAKLECFYFKLPEGFKSWKEPYQSLVKRTARYVVEHYPDKRNPEAPGYFRHLAFGARFLFIENRWYLQATPTYYYTRDGVWRVTAL